MVQLHSALEALARGSVLVLGGEITSDLEARGYSPPQGAGRGSAPRDVPDLVLKIHGDYLDAGAHVVTAFTSETSVRSLHRMGFGMRSAAMTSRAVDLACDALAERGAHAAVAGSLGTLESFDRERVVLAPASLRREHDEQATRLAASGCDLIVVGAMPSLVESIAATSAARSRSETVWVRLRLADAARLTDGSQVERGAALCVAAGASALVLECPANVDAAPTVGAIAKMSLGASVGFAVLLPRQPIGALSATTLASVRRALENGATILAGTDTTRAEHLRQIASAARTRAAA